jgi:hypothetical protein
MKSGCVEIEFLDHTATSSTLQDSGSIGLCFAQARPPCTAFYAISVRRSGILPSASFKFHLTMDTLAVQLTLPTTKRTADFHRLAIFHVGRM